MHILYHLQLCLRLFRRDDSAVAAIEAGFIFPLLVLILCGMMDTGVALLVNQKMITSCQSVADILAREMDINDAELNDAVVAGRLSLMPYPTASFGVHVAGIQFSGNNASAVIQWQDTVNTTANVDVVVGAAGLGIQDEGVVAVTTRYSHRPFFSSVFSGNIDMEEVAYVRGRRGLFITRTRS